MRQCKQQAAAATCSPRPPPLHLQSAHIMAQSPSSPAIVYSTSVFIMTCPPIQKILTSGVYVATPHIPLSANGLDDFSSCDLDNNNMLINLPIG